jgi:hypothetical protein
MIKLVKELHGQGLGIVVDGVLFVASESQLRGPMETSLDVIPCLVHASRVRGAIVDPHIKVGGRPSGGGVATLQLLYEQRRAARDARARPIGAKEYELEKAKSREPWNWPPEAAQHHMSDV